MAKINHNNHLDTIDSLFTDAKNKGVLHLKSSAGLVAGRHIFIGDKEHLNFGSLGYLSLETDERLKEGAIDFVRRFGTQSVMSRTYITTNIMEELEETMSRIFGFPTLVYSRASTAHISLIPTLVERNDAIILDQQCHFSIQTASQLQRQKGVTIEMVKHNNLNMLEAKIKELRATHRKIWYMADGVYSMFGDVVPMKELTELCEKYPQLWLYVDDAHGMSWKGKNGSGYVLDVQPMHPHMVLISTMAKGYGVHGGLAIFPDSELYRKVKVFGGPLSYSLPLSPADIGACLASAHIHLSSEITQFQEELETKINYANTLLDESGLPVISNPDTPIYFIGMGQPKVGYNMVSRLLEEGIYLNPSFFPMVPVKSTGLRFGLTRNHQLEDIKLLIDAMRHHFPLALAEEGRTENQVRRAFRLPMAGGAKKRENQPTNLDVHYTRSINELNTSEWNENMSHLGTIDAEGMRFIESVFSANGNPEENWDLHYFVVKDRSGEVVLSTFLVEGIFKDDFIASASISEQIERKRQTDPYYLTTRTLISGSTISEGEHLYINRSHSGWREALKRLFDSIANLQEERRVSKLLFGEFLANDHELAEVFLASGFFKVDMPHSNVVTSLNWETKDDFLEMIGRQNRKNVRKEALKYEHCFEVEVLQKLNEEQQEYFYDLFLQVKRRNYGLNFFDYPRKIMSAMSEHPNWEFVVLRLKPEFDARTERKPVSVTWCYRGETHYSPMIIGMDYDFQENFLVYKQSLYRIVMRARELNAEKVYLGFSADTEKKKYGAVQVKKVAFAQAQDNFNMEVIESMSERVVV